jgi:hypothetical protein
MKTLRSMALALVACAATLSVTACTAGVTTASSASSPATSPAATGHSASAAASSPSAAHSAPVPSASTVTISGPPGSVPVPAGAQVEDNVVVTGTVIVIFSGVTPAKVLAFYTEALPRAGYRITGSEMTDVAGGTAAIMFSGHGFTGEIAAVTDFTASPNSPGGNIPGLPHKDVSTFELMPHTGTS